MNTNSHGNSLSSSAVINDDIGDDEIVEDLYVDTDEQSYLVNTKNTDGWRNKLSNNYFLFQVYSFLLASLYLIVAILLPFLNKKIFSTYNFPLTSSFLQTLGAAIILFIFNVIQHYHHKNDLVTKSSLFDRHFVYKSLTMIPVSICFACVIVLTNIGISMISVNYHVIFKSTNIVWVVLFSFIIHKERPSIFIIISIILLMTGTILTGLVLHQDKSSSSFVPIFINLLSSFFESVMLVLLKWTCQFLFKKDETITVLEITFYKVAEGTIVILIPMFIIEHVKGFTIIPTLSISTIFLVLAGVVVTMVYQSSTVGLIKSLYVTTVGIITQVIIVPQIFLSIALYRNFTFDAMHIVGTVLAILGCLLFTFYNWYAVNYKKVVPKIEIDEQQ